MGLTAFNRMRREAEEAKRAKASAPDVNTSEEQAIPMASMSASQLRRASKAHLIEYAATLQLVLSDDLTNAQMADAIQARKAEIEAKKQLS